MHLTQDDSVWLLSSTTIRAPPVNVNRPASVVETPTTSSISGALNFIIAKWRPAEAWKKVLWMTLLLHLQHRSWVLHREQPTFAFHISQPVWLGPPSHSVVVLFDCRLSHTQLIVSSKSHEEGALWLWEALKIQLLLFKRVSQRGDSIVQSVTPGQKHFVSVVQIYLLHNNV